jgi:hypothetical protein
MMLCSVQWLLAETVEPEAVFGGIERLQKSGAKLGPLILADVALEDAVLHTVAVVLAVLGYPPETTTAFRRDR